MLLKLIESEFEGSDLVGKISQLESEKTQLFEKMIDSSDKETQDFDSELKDQVQKRISEGDTFFELEPYL